MMCGAPVPTLAADRLLMTRLDPDGGGLLGGHVWTRSGPGGGGTPPPSLYAASTPRTPFSNYVLIAQELPDGHLKTRPKSSPLSPSAPRQTVLPAGPSLCAGESYTAELPGDSHGHVQPRPDSRTFSSPQNQAPFLLARRPVPPATSQQLSVSMDFPVRGVRCDNMGSSVSASFAERPLVGVHPRRSERRRFTPSKAQQSPRPTLVGQDHSVIHPLLARVCMREILPRSPLTCSWARGASPVHRATGSAALWHFRTWLSGRPVSSSLGCRPSRGSVSPGVASCGTP